MRDLIVRRGVIFVVFTEVRRGRKRLEQLLADVQDTTVLLYLADLWNSRVEMTPARLRAELTKLTAQEAN